MSCPGAPAASAVLDFFTTPIPSVPALSTKSFVSLIASKLPSGDRVVQLVMEATGAGPVRHIRSGQFRHPGRHYLRPQRCPVGIGSPARRCRPVISVRLALNDARDAAQAALDDAENSLNEVFDRLELAVTEQNVFAVLRSVQYLTDAISDLRTAAQTLIDNGDAIFNTAISDLTAFVTSIVSDVRDQVFQAFPFGALTFSTDIPGAVLFNLHFAREIPG